MKNAEKALASPNVSGNLITRIRQLAKDIKRQTDEYNASPVNAQILTNTKLSRGQAVFQSQNSMDQLLDLLKLIQKNGHQSAMSYAQQLSKDMHEIKENAKFKSELQALDAAINESQPDYLQWYKESKVIDRTLALLEYQ